MTPRAGGWWPTKTTGWRCGRFANRWAGLAPRAHRQKWSERRGSREEREESSREEREEFDVVMR
jgi:hypothetical protein